jgi:hypothetical protein
MAENNNSENNVANETSNSANTANETTDSKNGAVAELIAERKKRQELEKQLKAISDEKKKQEEAKLLEEGKLKEVLTAKEKELEDYKKSVEQDLALASEFKDFQSKRRDSLKQKFGDKWVDSFNNIPLSDLETLADKFVPANPELNRDKGTGGSGEPGLTEDEKKEAQRMGLSEDGYKQFKKKREEIKGKK